MFKRLVSISVPVLSLLVVSMLILLPVQEANGQWNPRTAWGKGSLWGKGHTKVEEDPRGCAPNCPSHRQGPFGSQDPDGNFCDPRPIDQNGYSGSGCLFNFLYNCVSKDCVDANGDLVDKKKCHNQIASDPQSSHTQDGGGITQDVENTKCDKKNCRSLLTTVTFSFGEFDLYCPKGQLPVNVVLDSFVGFTEYCEGDRDVNNDCCRSALRNANGTCFDVYGDGCAGYDPSGNCIPDSDDIGPRVTTELCTGGAELGPDDEYPCTDLPAL